MGLWAHLGGGGALVEGEAEDWGGNNRQRTLTEGHAARTDVGASSEQLLSESGGKDRSANPRPRVWPWLQISSRSHSRASPGVLPSSMSQACPALAQEAATVSWSIQIELCQVKIPSFHGS